MNERMVAKVRSNISRVKVKEGTCVDQNGSSRVFICADEGIETRVQIGKPRRDLLQCGKQIVKDKTNHLTRGDSKDGQRKYGRNNGTRDSFSSKLIEIKGKAQRKALADISNVKTNGLKNEMCGSYKSMISLPVSKPRISVGTNIKTSSRNPHTQTRISLPASKPRISIGTNIKTSSRNPRTQTRISLPVSKPQISVGTNVKMRSRNPRTQTRISLPVSRAQISVGSNIKTRSRNPRTQTRISLPNSKPRISVGANIKTSSRNPCTQTRISLPVSRAQISFGTNIKTRSRNPHTQTRISLPVSKPQIYIGTNIKTSSRNPRTQTRVPLPVSIAQISVGTNVKMRSRNPRTQTRISVPDFKQAREVYTDNKKRIPLNLDKSKGTFGFSVKPRVGTKMSTHVSDSKAHTGRTQVNNGFKTTSMKSQPRAKIVDLTRRSVKTINIGNLIIQPLAKTSLRIPSKVNVSAKVTSCQKTVKIVGAIKCRRKEDVATYKSEDSASCSKQDRLTLQDCIDCINNPENMGLLKRSSRRKSFTSLLIKSKLLLEANYGDVKQQTLPSIYDDHNPLEVADYVEDIYHYYWAMEAQSQSLVNYMEMQVEITPQMRGILINWLIEVHLKFGLMQETLYLTVSLFDKFLSLVTMKRNEMQLVGLTVLLLASKYEDFYHPSVSDLIDIAESYTCDQMLAMEKLILNKLMFRLNIPTAYVFMLRFLKAAQSDSKLEHLSFYLCELCLVEYEALKFKPSLICASAIYVARRTMQIVPAWNPLLENHTRYKETQLRDCARMILKFHKAIETSALQVTYEKYKTSCKNAVANIKPLNKLPI
ncbi:cyclin-A2-1-like [Impatiens glandulifera]|uniref:cyclin-A2-1-like n=1 Tax=Impatiens glandulifera TaxID=253017 RepID=UPI001FB14C24|nr:cyclin-A2-1-like [Impatiens glandulifera]